MEDQNTFWRTRTIAEAQAQGYSHVRATCSECGRITDIPWGLLVRPPRITTDTFLGNLPLKCQRCGSVSPLIGVRHHGNTQGYGKPGGGRGSPRLIHHANRWSTSVNAMGGNLNSGKPWSEMDLADLWNCMRLGDPIWKIADFLCRDADEVREKVAEIDLNYPHV
jgi:hypothetical protein